MLKKAILLTFTFLLNPTICNEDDQIIRKFIIDADTNKDNLLSKQEFLDKIFKTHEIHDIENVPASRLKEEIAEKVDDFFMAVDVNGDGISYEEFASSHSQPF